MKWDWKKETARDLIALGSIPFFILVLVRVYILAQPAYFTQFLLAGIIFLILSYIFKASMYSGLGLIIGFFLLNHYNDMKFTVFAIIAYILLIASLYYIGEPKKKITLGVLFGAIASGISYYIVNLF